MKHFLVICFIATTAFGQDAQVKGRQLIDDAVKALGGEKFLSVQNRIETGRAYSFAFDTLSGLSVARFYTRYIPLDPSKSGMELAQQEHQGLNKNEAFYRLFREEGGWEVTFRGPTKLEKEQVERYHDSILHNVFYILRNRLQEPGMIFEARGSDVIENTPMNLVDIIDSKNRVVTAYFHPTTKLPLRQKWDWRDPETRERFEEVTRFARFRNVDGTQWPFQTNRERNGRKTYEMFADTVVINQVIDERRFAIPDASSLPFKTSTDTKKKR
jgi:hypothetical protein